MNVFLIPTWIRASPRSHLQRDWWTCKIRLTVYEVHSFSLSYDGRSLTSGPRSTRSVCALRRASSGPSDSVARCIECRPIARPPGLSDRLAHTSHISLQTQQICIRYGLYESDFADAFRPSYDWERSLYRLNQGVSKHAKAISLEGHWESDFLHCTESQHWMCMHTDVAARQVTQARSAFHHLARSRR